MGDPAERRYLIVAGEASGDLHAARLVRAAAASVPSVFRGAGGPSLRAAGVETLVDMSELNVIGFSAVARRLPKLLGALRRLRDEAVRFRPHAAVLVDSPGFNFRLGPQLHRAGIPVFYYIAPQVWAWHAERAQAMAAWVDRLAVVFPFEEPLFRAAGVPTSFVGHPLLEELGPEVPEPTFRAELGVGPETRLLGLLPGSRPQEVRALLPVLLGAASQLEATRPDLTAVLPLAPGLTLELAESVSGGRLERGPGGATRLVSREGTVHVVRERTRSVMAYARACAVASGTATLETALFATPLVVVYRVGAVNYWIARRVVRLERIGLPNIVAGASVAPELVQHDCTPDRVAATLEPWLDDAHSRAEASARLGVVRQRLGEPGASRRAAALLRELAP
jgi:lipid-A-disaccharide synthase